jgi:hypothetical protein
MKKRFFTIILITFFSVAICNTAFASVLQCGSLSARVGTYKEAVWEKCGAPKARSTLGSGIEKWVYFQHIYFYVLYFKDGILEKIEIKEKRHEKITCNCCFVLGANPFVFLRPYGTDNRERIARSRA